MKLIATLMLCLHLLTPIAVWAQETTKLKNPLDYGLKQYGLIVGIAMLGGVASWFGKVKRGEIPALSINHFVGELAISAFSGLLCFWLCEWAGFAPLLTAALTGIFGHMGTRGITLLEDWGKNRLPDFGKKTS